MKKIISMLLLAVMLSSALEAFATMSYSDITNEHWAAEYIKQLTDKGILFGLSLIHISEPTRLEYLSRMPSSA